MENAGNNGDKKKMNQSFIKNKIAFQFNKRQNADMLKFNIRFQAIKLIIPDGQMESA